MKDASDKKILVDMLFWAVDNPAPANLLLISGDRNFSNALHQFRLRRYNILLAKPEKASAPLIAAASTVWLWTSLASGGGPLSSNEVAQHATSKSNFNPPGSLSRNYEQVEFSQQLKVFHAESSSANSSSWASQQKVIYSEGLSVNSSSCSSARTDDIKSIGNYFHNYLNQPTLSRPNDAPFTYLNQPQQAQAKQFRKAPHEFFYRKEPGASASTSTPINGKFGLSGMQGSSYVGNMQNHSMPHPLPNNLPSQQRSNRSDNALFPIFHYFHSYYPIPRAPLPSVVTSNTNTNGNWERYAYRPIPRPDGLTASLTTQMIVSDFTKLSVSDRFNYDENHPNMQDGLASNHYSLAMDSRPPLPSVVTRNTNANGNRESKGFPPLADNMQDNMGIILLALDTLRTEKSMPTEANITDCIHFGDLKCDNMDVQKALDSAVENNLVVKQNVGALLLYVGKNDKLWKCINPSCGNFYQYPKAMWDKIRMFLTSAVGRSIITTSHCRYEAALILKKSCLKDLPLGEVLQILSIVISYKKWITHHPSGWHPVTITLEEGKAGFCDTASI